MTVSAEPLSSTINMPDTSEAYHKVAGATLLWCYIYYSYMAIDMHAGGMFKDKQGTDPHCRKWGDRVFNNLREQSPVFIVSMWTYAFIVDPDWAGTVGFCWCGFRLLYPIIWALGPQPEPPAPPKPFLGLSTVPGYIINMFFILSTLFKIADVSLATELRGVVFPIGFLCFAANTFGLTKLYTNLLGSRMKAKLDAGASSTTDM